MAVGTASRAVAGVWNNYFLPLVMLSDDRKYPATLGLTTWKTAADRVPELMQYTIGGAVASVVPLARRCSCCSGTGGRA